MLLESQETLLASARSARAHRRASGAAVALWLWKRSAMIKGSLVHFAWSQLIGFPLNH